MSSVVSVETRVEQQFRIRDAASLLRVSKATVYRWLPQIRHYRIPAGGLTKEIVLIPESALQDFMTRYEKEPEKKTK